jgi:tRNA (guanine-N7-)-methyltransferase
LVKNVDWDNIYYNSKPPDELDIGCGKGIFLLQMAEKYPEKNFLGIEIRGALTEWTNEVAEKEGLGNCHALRYSVANGLPFIKDGSIDNIYYLFPDPWPKRRHQKRRAFNMNFLGECYKKLKKGGRLYLATDVDYVHEYQMDILKKFEKFEVKQLSEKEWNFPATNKENFCFKKNIFVYRSVCLK